MTITLEDFIEAMVTKTSYKSKYIWNIIHNGKPVTILGEKSDHIVYCKECGHQLEEKYVGCTIDWHYFIWVCPNHPYEGYEEGRID